MEINKKKIMYKGVSGLDSKEIDKIILGWVVWNLNQDTKKLVESDLYKNIRNELSNKICAFINSKQVRNIAYEFAEQVLNENEKNGRTFKQILPIGFENSLKVLIYNKSPEITITIKSYINSGKFEKIVKKEINKFLVNVNPIVGKFINAESVEEKIMSSLNSYFDNTENIMNIVTIVNDKIDDINDKSLSEISDYLPYEGKKSMVIATVDSILNLCKDEKFIKKVEHVIDSNILSLDTIESLLKSIGIKDHKLLDSIHKNIKEYLRLDI